MGGQLRSYMRTPVVYYIAQLLSSSGCPAVVMGTGNKDEDGYLAYFCKAGDGVVDVQLISDLHKHEVFAVGNALSVPQSILDAMKAEQMKNGLSSDALRQFEEWGSMAVKIHKRNQHKLNAPFNIVTSSKL